MSIDTQVRLAYAGPEARTVIEGWCRVWGVADGVGVEERSQAARRMPATTEPTKTLVLPSTTWLAPLALAALNRADEDCCR